MCLLETDAKTVYDPFPDLCEELSPPSINTGVAVVAKHSPCASHCACLVFHIAFLAAALRETLLISPIYRWED